MKKIKNKKKHISKRKNVSQTIKNGTTLQTRDEFLHSGKNYKKDGYDKKGYYRRVVVVDSNRDDELAIVKLTTKGRYDLPKYQDGKSTYNSFIETRDRYNKPIKVGKRFIKNSNNRDISSNYIDEIKKNCFVNSSNSLKKKNKKNVRDLKSR